MRIGDKAERFEKKIKDLIFGPRGAGEPLRIRQAILDEIEENIEPLGRAKSKFPFDQLVVHLMFEDDKQKAKLETVFIEGGTLKEQIQNRLRHAGCDLPVGLTVDVNLVEEAEPDWENRYFHVQYLKRKPHRRQASDDRKAKAKASVPPARLTVLSGQADRKQNTFRQSRINVGRLSAVVEKGRIERRNDLVFLEGKNEINATVSRRHGHIAFDEERREFRLYDDQSVHGTRILRDDASLDVPSGSRGTKLRTGDEIYFGQARVRFEIKK